MERVAIDILGPLPESDAGNKYLLIAMDYFSKWPEGYALPNMEAQTVADALLEGLLLPVETVLKPRLIKRETVLFFWCIRPSYAGDLRAFVPSVYFLNIST